MKSFRYPTTGQSYADWLKGLTHSQRRAITRVTAYGKYPVLWFESERSEFQSAGSAPWLVVSVNDSQQSVYGITARGRVRTISGRNV